MTDRRIRHLPVCRAGRLVGIISIGDLVKYRIEAIEAEAAALLQRGEVQFVINIPEDFTRRLLRRQVDIALGRLQLGVPGMLLELVGIRPLRGEDRQARVPQPVRGRLLEPGGHLELIQLRGDRGGSGRLQARSGKL